MQKNILLILIVTVCYYSGFAQKFFNSEVQKKIIEGYNYIEQNAEQNPKDLVIITVYNNDKFYFVNSYGKDIIEVKEIVPPSIKNVQADVTFIEKDSIADVFWINKNKYQNLLLNESVFPFNKINSRKNVSNTFRKLQQEILSRKQNALIDKYYLKLKEKYPDLKKLKSENTQMTFFELTEDVEITETTIIYPQEALLNETQGTVRIAYVLTKDYDVVDVKVFKHLKNGCTDAVIKSIMENSELLKSKGYKNDENLFIDANIKFTLK